MAAIKGKNIAAPRSVKRQKAREKIFESALQLLKERSEEHTSELQSRQYLVCRLLLEKKNDAEVNTFGYF